MLPVELLTGSSTKETSWFHCKNRRVSQQLDCAAVATGALPELTPTEIYCTHACTVTMPASGTAAGIPLELRANTGLNKSHVVWARLLHRQFYLQPKGLSLQSDTRPCSSLALNKPKPRSHLSGSTSGFNIAVTAVQQIPCQPQAALQTFSTVLNFNGYSLGRHRPIWFSLTSFLC